MSEQNIPINFCVPPPGYRRVKFLALYAANVLIQPAQAKDEYAGWLEYPETATTYNIDGRELAAMAEHFGLKNYPVRANGGMQNIKHSDFRPVSQELKSQHMDGFGHVQVLFAKETTESLKLVAVYKDGTWFSSSYRGNYDLHWEDFEFQED